MLDGRVKTLHPRDPRRPAGAPRRARAHGRAQGARHRHHRPAHHQPVPVRQGHRQPELHAGRRDREHRHRRPRHAARRGQELAGRGRRHRPDRLPAGDRRTEVRRRPAEEDQVRARQEGVRAHRRLRRHDHQLPHRAGGRRRGPRRGGAQARRLPRHVHAAAHQGAGHALRREPAPEAPPSTATAQPAAGHAGRAGRSCRAKSCRSTTSPTPTRRGNASRPSTCPPA